MTDVRRIASDSASGGGISRRAMLELMSAGGMAALVAACGGGGQAQTPQSPSSAGKGPVTGQIRFSWWGTGARSQKTMGVMDLFQKAHPGATIQGEPVGDFPTYWQKLTVQASAQNMPAVPQMQVRYLNQYATRHALLALDDLTKSGAIDVSGIPRNILDAGRAPDGKLYMIPTGSATNAWMYNSTMAQKAGLPALTEKMTWTDLQNWLLQAKDKLPSGVYASDLKGGDDALWYGWVLSHGQPLFKQGALGFPKQLMIDYWNWWDKLRKAGATVTADMFSEEPSDNQQGYITLGKVMFDTRPPNQLGAIQAPMTAKGIGTLELAMFPRGSASNGMALVNSGMSIAANCNNIPTAAAWVNFFANDPQGAKLYASDNGAVTVTKLLNTQINDPSTPPATQTSLAFIKKVIGAKPTMINYPTGYFTVTDSLLRNFTSFAHGQVSVQKAVDTFFSEANSALGQ